MNEHHKLNYIEFPAQDLNSTKALFEKVFNWTFEDFGSQYTAFSNQGLGGGFYCSTQSSTTVQGGALAIFYSDDLEDSLERVIEAGGSISKPIFAFPGGRRFQFIEPSGNELAIGSDQ